MHKQSITSFEEAVAYLFAIPKFTGKHSIEETRAFLAKIGSPDKRLTIIHVAGTNGKGSTCAYMAGILRAAGKNVGLFTSPHLVDVRERFSLNGEMMSREEFLSEFLFVYENLDWENSEREDFYHPTFFEYIFFMAMDWYGKMNPLPDVVILETGLGGRLDATNAVSDKALSVITHISLDHTEYLGDTVSQIAGEKAGIIFPGKPVVYQDSVPEAAAVIAKRAAELGSPAYPCGGTIGEKAINKCPDGEKEDGLVNACDGELLGISHTEKGIDFSVSSRYYGYMCLTLPTIATYQVENAALAVRAIEVLDGGRSVSAEAVKAGLYSSFWAGRMEEILPNVYVDGAHNEDGIRAFLQTVSEDGLDRENRLLLFGVVADKDFLHMVRRIGASGLFSNVTVTPLHTGRSAGAEQIGALMTEAGLSCRIGTDAAHTLQELIDTRRPNQRIYAAGSLYLVGELKECFHD